MALLPVLRPGPRGTRPHPGRVGRRQAPAHTLCGFARRRRGRSCRAAFPAALLRTPRAAAPLRCARPLRRAGPAPRASCAPPPAPPLALVRAFALRRVSLPPSAFGPALAPLRASYRAPLLCLGLGPCAARRLAGGFAWPLRAAPALRSAPAPLAGLRPPFPPSGGRGLGLLRARPAALAAPFRRASGVGWGSPLRPPAPPPPLGAPGGPEPVPGCRKSHTSDGGPVGPGADRWGRFGPVDSPEIVNQGLHEMCGRGFCRSLGLDFPRFPWYADVPEPVRAPPGAAIVCWCPCDGEKPLGLIDQAAFLRAA